MGKNQLLIVILINEDEKQKIDFQKVHRFELTLEFELRKKKDNLLLARLLVVEQNYALV